MLDLKRLRVFKEVADRGSFSAAADALSYTQPAVSHHVARLELEVGAKLVTRRSRGSHLTPAGEVLLAHAEAILDRVAEAELALAEVAGPRVPVRLGAFATASATIVAEAIAALRVRSPGLRLTLMEGEAADSLERLKAHGIDIAVVFDSVAHPLAPDPQLKYEHLGRDPMLLALPARHPAARRPSIRLADLAREDWIEGAGADTPCSLILVDACQRAGFEPRISFNSGNYQVVQRLVAAGVGVALMPRLALEADMGEVVIRSLAQEGPFRRIGLAMRRDGYRSPAMAAVVDALVAACASSLELLTEGAVASE